MSKVNFVATEQQITMFIGNKIEQVNRGHRNFDLIKEELKKPSNDIETLKELLKTPVDQVITQIKEAVLDVEIDSLGFVYVNGKKMNDYFAERMRYIVGEGYDPAPYVAFMKNLLQNPSEQSRERLFAFLDKNNSPITEDGHFITFKRVSSTFKDLYTGNFDNSPGKIVKVDRSMVDANSSNTCSHGLHVAASHYLSNYASAVGNKTIVCKVNPMHVVAVPPDYREMKMRVCEYEVLSEIGAESMTEVEERVFVNSDTLESAKPIVSEVTRVFKETIKGPKTVFETRDGRKFSSVVLNSLLSEGTVASVSKKISVPESTLRGWVKRIEMAPEREMLYFCRAGVQFSEDEIMKGVEAQGLTAWARSKGIPSGTLSGWVKKIKAAG